MALFIPSDGQRVEIRKKLTSTAVTQVYPSSGTVPSNKIRAFLEAINFCNITGSAATVDLLVNDGSSDFYILKDYSLAANTRLSVDALPAGLRTGDVLKVRAGTSSAIDVVGVVIEQFPPQQASGL